MIDTVPFTSPEGPLKLFNAFVEAVGSRPPGAKASYIYCGGSWTMSRGNGGLDKWTDERQPNAGRVELTKWRSQVEKPVLSCMSLYSFPGFAASGLTSSRQGQRDRHPTWNPVWKIRISAWNDGLPSRPGCWKEG